MHTPIAPSQIHVNLIQICSVFLKAKKGLFAWNIVFGKMIYNYAKYVNVLSNEDKHIELFLVMLLAIHLSTRNIT